MIERDDKLADNVYSQIFDIQNRMVMFTQTVPSTITTFAYGDGEIRTITVEEDPAETKRTTYYPFPGYEEEVIAEWICMGICWWAVQDTIQRSTYTLAGQTIAIRVSDHPDSDNNGIFYVLSDRLGSTTLLVYANDHDSPLPGTLVPGSEAYYLPYGGYREEPGSGEITDRGYTGHAQQNDLKLIYMQARFYVQDVG